jgi:uncharacterized protein YqeY
MTMDLYKQIETDMKSAMKEGAAEKLSVLRMLISAVRMQEIEKNVKSLQDPDILQILQRQIKQRRESIEQFRNGNRPELAEKEEREQKILEAYMPEQLGEADVEALVKAAITELGAQTKADTGKVMKAVMEKAKGRCDGKTVNQLVMKYLK